MVGPWNLGPLCSVVVGIGTAAVEPGVAVMSVGLEATEDTQDVDALVALEDQVTTWCAVVIRVPAVDLWCVGSGNVEGRARS
jgi:hypothetical protein